MLEIMKYETAFMYDYEMTYESVMNCEEVQDRINFHVLCLRLNVLFQFEWNIISKKANA